MLVKLSVDGLHGSIEFKVHGQFQSYVARIHWGEMIQWNSSLPGYYKNSVARSFGTGVAAENWLLDQLENPSFFILSQT
jgi:hypothetical protein